jgi:hypothetical protein
MYMGVNIIIITTAKTTGVMLCAQLQLAAVMA